MSDVRALLAFRFCSNPGQINKCMGIHKKVGCKPQGGILFNTYHSFSAQERTESCCCDSEPILTVEQTTMKRKTRRHSGCLVAVQVVPVRVQWFSKTVGHLSYVSIFRFHGSVNSYPQHLSHFYVGYF
jgi:hypothetical protein